MVRYPPEQSPHCCCQCKILIPRFPTAAVCVAHLQRREHGGEEGGALCSGQRAQAVHNCGVHAKRHRATAGRCRRRRWQPPVRLQIQCGRRASQSALPERQLLLLRVLSRSDKMSGTSELQAHAALNTLGQRAGESIERFCCSRQQNMPVEAKVKVQCEDMHATEHMPTTHLPE